MIEMKIPKTIEDKLAILDGTELSDSSLTYNSPDYDIYIGMKITKDGITFSQDGFGHLSSQLLTWEEVDQLRQRFNKNSIKE